MAVACDVGFDELKTKLSPIFESAPVRRAVLFGSRARGDATQNSDLDIVVDSEGKLLNMNFYGLLQDLVDVSGLGVDMFEASEIEKNSPIDVSIRREGVVLYERNR